MAHYYSIAKSKLQQYNYYNCQLSEKLKIYINIIYIIGYKKIIG